MKSVWGTKRWAAATVALLLLGGATCTKLLDHSAQRCTVDDDCSTYSPYHPFCTDHVCVASGLNPAGCFYATESNPPVTQANFLNGCSRGTLAPQMGRAPEACLEDDDRRMSIAADAGVMTPPPRAAPRGQDMKAPLDKCLSLVPAGGKPIYISGSSNFQALLKAVTPAIIKLHGLIPIFRITTSCTGAHSMALTTTTPPAFVADHYIKDPTSNTEAYAQIFLGNGADGVNCLLDGGSTGIPVDVGESEIYPETCDTGSNSADTVSEGLGPILPLVLVVPPRSSQQAISYETARQVFGSGGFPPWNNPQQIFIRGNGTATLRLLAKELDLTPAQIWGIDQGSALSMATSVGSVSSTLAEQTVGILGTDLYDSLQGNLKALAFQAKGQDCAYVPDSALGKPDKLNVRDGHYPLWGRFHFFIARTSGTALSNDALNFVFELTTAKLDTEIFTAFVAANLVPTCAMQVRRDKELGDLAADNPAPYACGCAFDMIAQKLDKPPAGCNPCTKNDDCEQLGGVRRWCNYNFCEARQ